MRTCKLDREPLDPKCAAWMVGWSLASPAIPTVQFTKCPPHHVVYIFHILPLFFFSFITLVHLHLNTRWSKSKPDSWRGGRLLGAWRVIERQRARASSLVEWGLRRCDSGSNGNSWAWIWSSPSIPWWLVSLSEDLEIPFLLSVEGWSCCCSLHCQEKCTENWGIALECQEMF